MAAERDRRYYSRVASDVAVRWLAVRVDRPTRDYLEEVARNISPRGMFIETAQPQAPGTLLRLEIRIKGEDTESQPVFAKAIVRWRQRWGRARGMGVEFVEFEGLGEREIGSWLESVLTAPRSLELGEPN